MLRWPKLQLQKGSRHQQRRHPLLFGALRICRMCDARCPRLVRGGAGLTRGYPLTETSAREAQTSVTAGRLKRDGYLFVRGLFPRQLVLSAHREITAAIESGDGSASLLGQQWIANLSAVRKVLENPIAPKVLAAAVQLDASVGFAPLTYKWLRSVVRRI